MILSIAQFALRRLVQAIPILVGVVAMNFFVANLAPGDMADVLAGEAGAASPEFLAELRAKYGLDQPMIVRFGLYMRNMFQLDLGYSFRYGVPVTELLMTHLWPTLLLMLTSILMAFSSGVVLGVLAARTVNRWPDYLISVTALIAYATPVFWLGLMMVVVFSVQLGWLPSSGMENISAGYTGLRRVADILMHMIMPATILGLYLTAFYVRLMRASMLEVSGQDFVTTARAKGLGENAIAYRHVLRNAILPMVTMLGLQIGAMLGGAVLVETVFAWPGLGRLAYTAVFQRDLNLLLGLLFICSVMVIVINIATEIAYRLIDPRIPLK
ncbi:ABC transporter permease [Paracoccus pantotrophus]|uniref:ABC transporter permease n=1 Tax=Paracoccus pantotrophus TaxID=82367 RepID=UPI000E0981C0|nr:ABC transporter permease [Paracoccus pantotrophus]RDD95285.1 ABC transporter permease [Paracoccus pantotrophus]WGR64177.1 ABC transporter permease [Paracoccus pantotrophus]